MSFRSTSALGTDSAVNASEPFPAKAAHKREDLIQICVSAAKPSSRADSTPGHDHWALGCLRHV
jgi:hypothetical protein